MKNILLMLAVFCLFTTRAGAQNTNTTQDQPDQLNLPGDNLNLYAVMKLFQESPTLEEFEKKLNDESTKINNLDLDGDNQIDYIKVVDHVDGDTHNIALKVAVNKDEDQDVAVFVVKKDRNGQVIIQLIGDEDLYGKDYIIEPDTEAPTTTPNPGYAGNDQPPPPPVDGAAADYQVSSWPVIQYMYVPTYSVWSSPWRWGSYPSYWHPWTPFFWHEYYGYHYHWNYYYHAHYRYTPVYRIPAWRDRYYGSNFRSRSTFVENRARGGSYRQTYSRPDLANRGADLFKRDNPRAPHLNRPLPKFDNNNNNRPIITRPNRPGNGNGNGRPGGDNNNRPGTRPGNPNPGNPTPGNGNNRPDRPTTRPVNPNPTPGNGNNNSRPVNPNPSNGNNTPDRPITRPANPNPTPGNGNNRPDRPITRPVNPTPNPGNGNTVPNRPVTRPVNPNPANNGNMHNRPNTTQPAAPRPANNFPNRPVTRPMPAPRPQEQRPPVQRPAGQPAAPPREHRGNN